MAFSLVPIRARRGGSCSRAASCSARSLGSGASTRMLLNPREEFFRHAQEHPRQADDRLFHRHGFDERNWEALRAGQDNMSEDPRIAWHIFQAQQAHLVAQLSPLFRLDVPSLWSFPTRPKQLNWKSADTFGIGFEQHLAAFLSRRIVPFGDQGRVVGFELG